MGQASVPMKQASFAARLYGLFALLGVLLVAPTMPPFQNADETNHLLRASQISHGGLLAERLPDGQQGGRADKGLEAASAAFAAIPFHRDRKVSRGLYAPRAWGLSGPEGFPNTAVDPPFFYLPAAMALAAARALHWTVLQGVMTARLATGTAAVMLGVAAVARAGTAAPWLFSLLLLPMSLSLMAAATQDALLLACTALAASMSCQARQGVSHRGFAVLTLLLALVGMARPPYAGFALVLLTARVSRRLRLAGIGCVAASVLAWSLLCAPHVVLAVFPAGGVDPQAQAWSLLREPWRLLRVLAATWRLHGQDLAISFVGEPGWLDVDLPGAYHLAARILLGLALLLLLGSRRERMRPSQWAGLGGILAAVLGVLLLQYLTWTLPGAPAIEGLQGRYFLPPALMLASVLGVAGRGPVGTLASGARWAILLFPVLSLPVLLHALLVRYYF